MRSLSSTFVDQQGKLALRNHLLEMWSAQWTLSAQQWECLFGANIVVNVLTAFNNTISSEWWLKLAALDFELSFALAELFSKWRTNFWVKFIFFCATNPIFNHNLFPLLISHFSSHRCCRNKHQTMPSKY
jgi:hypothetical protein